MRVGPWWRWGRLLSSRPEASCSSSTVRFRLGSPLLPLLLSLPLVAGLVSEAQAQTTFVKNTGQTTVLNNLQGFTADIVQPFTTGSNAAGYRLTSVVFKFRGLSDNSPSFTVAIYTDSSGSPGNSLGTLTNPALSSGSDVEYTFPASGQGIDLAANTQYWIVIDNTSTSPSDVFWGWAITASDSEDAGAAPGWSIGNSKSGRAATSTGGFTIEGTDVLQIEIIGTTKTATNTAATGAATITGIATQGQTLTVNQGTLADADGLPSTTFPAGYTFQWKRNNTNITGATSRTYTLVQADVGQNIISVTVSFTDGGGSTESRTSIATQTVANVNDDPTGAPSISGTAAQGQTLTADTSEIADPDGLGSFSYQWKRGTTSISGATSSTYTLVGDDVGETITVTVSWTDGGGTSESLTSAATAQVAAGVTVSFKESAHEVEEGDAVTL
ncbi:MAG: hypothetical protein F4X50_08650, partial [Synechococcus sp. SB0662_bin_14]|nr:hypothetical protein [Synechococcus sp. SB0662_bin_14]